MTTLTITATPTMLAGHIAAIKAIQQGNYPPRLKKKKRASLPRTAQKELERVSLDAERRPFASSHNPARPSCRPMRSRG